MDYFVEIHPYNNLATIPSGTEIIIMGTCPPQDNEGDTFKWYYGSRHNYLWNKIFVQADGFMNQPAFSLDEVQKFLKGKKTWMFDICKRYSRAVQGNALDSNLKDIQKEKLSDLLAACPYLTQIILTGTKAETLFRQALEEESLIDRYKFNEHTKGQGLPRVREIVLRGSLSRQMKIITVASPSRRNGAVSYVLEHFKKAMPGWFASTASQ